MTEISKPQSVLGGTFRFPNTSITVKRMGYGAMQLAGQDGDKRVWGPPRDVPGAIAVLREAIASGLNHIDTSDFYGPHVTNHLIKQALHPFPDNLVIVTKVGARRGADGSWPHARSRQEVIDAVHSNLRNLGLDALDVVNLRLGGLTGPTDEPFGAADSVGRVEAAGLDSAYRPKHCLAQAAGRGAGDHGNCVHPELLQRGPARRRRIH